MTTNRTPTQPIPLLTAAQRADFEHACEVLDIDPDKKLAEWRVDTMNLGKRDMELFVQHQLDKMIREAQELEPLGDGAIASKPAGPSTGTRQKRKSAPQDLLTRLRGAIQEVDQHVAGKVLGNANIALEKAKAILIDLINVLEGNVMDKMLDPARADEILLEASSLLGTSREAVELLRKQMAARQREAAASGPTWKEFRRIFMTLLMSNVKVKQAINSQRRTVQKMVWKV